MLHLDRVTMKFEIHNQSSTHMNIPVKRSWLRDSAIIVGFEPTPSRSKSINLDRSATEAQVRK